MKKIILSTLLLLSPWLAQAAEIKGYVRNVNHEGHSFSLDVPPLQRIWVSPATSFDSGKGYEAFKNLKEGTYVSVQGTSQSNQVMRAEVVKSLQAPLESAKGTIVDLNQSFLIEVNQKAKVKDEDLEILAVEVFDDLCQQGLDCESGSMSIRLVVNKGREKKDILLTSKEGRKPVKPVVSEVLGYKIELIEMGESAAMLVVRK